MKTPPDDRFVSAVAHSIRASYIEEKRIIIGKKFRISTRHDNPRIWKKASEQCLKLKADPESYVRACFAYCSMSTGPFANMLGGPAAKKWYKKFLAKVQDRTSIDSDISESAVEALDRSRLESDIRNTRTTMKLRTGNFMPTVDNVDWLCNWTSKVPPHIRAMLAYPDKRILERCGEEAYEKLTSNPNITRAASKMGYPMQEILEWLAKR